MFDVLVIAALRPQLCPRVNLSHFLRIERDTAGGSRHYVVHTHDPKFTLELTPDAAAPDHVGRGVIKRVHVPNSWAGDYGRYAKFITAAQKFFGRSFAPAAKTAGELKVER